MKHCIECGSKLEKKFLANEGDIPFCDSCAEYRFPIFNTAVIVIVMNSTRDKILLIQQYGGKDFILVAGYINKGENAEETVKREVLEELGLKVEGVKYNTSQYFGKSNTLMLNFSCVALDEDLNGMTDEVDKAEWFEVEESRRQIKEASLAQLFLEHFITHNLKLMS